MFTQSCGYCDAVTCCCNDVTCCCDAVTCCCNDVTCCCDDVTCYCDDVTCCCDDVILLFCYIAYAKDNEPCVVFMDEIDAIGMIICSVVLVY